MHDCIDWVGGKTGTSLVMPRSDIPIAPWRFEPILPAMLRVNNGELQSIDWLVTNINSKVFYEF
jgi:hypothetical protein